MSLLITGHEFQLVTQGVKKLSHKLKFPFRIRDCV
jgi:hypothetical protein